MMTPGYLLECDAKFCIEAETVFEATERLARISAERIGWTIQESGHCWCPRHRPV